MSINIDLLKHHPWLPSLKNDHSDLLSVDSIRAMILNDDDKNLQNRIYSFFHAAFEGLQQLTDYRIDDNNINLYILLKILLGLLENKSISNRIAELYSKIAYDELNKESDYNLYKIYNDLELNVQYEENPIIYKEIIVKDMRESYETHFKIHFIDYLKYSSYLQDDYRKLINNSLLNGYVYLKPQSLNRLIQESVRRKLLSSELSEEFKNEFLSIKEIKNLMDLIQSIWELKKELIEQSLGFEFKEGMDFSKHLPPCIKEIILKSKEGQNLQHNERLVVLFFLIALNYPKDYIINIFSRLPDFNMEKTTYQINFAKRKDYSPHSCSTLKSNKLCMAKKYIDDLCLNGFYSKKLDSKILVKHPLFYVQFKYNTSNKKFNFDKTHSLEKNE